MRCNPPKKQVAIASSHRITTRMNSGMKEMLANNIFKIGGMVCDFGGENGNNCEINIGNVH